jgi:anthranilate/para-aminobenzoate synthase component II
MARDGREHITELDQLVGGGKKRRRCCCCATHPICCTATLLLVIGLCLAVVILGSVFEGKVDQAVQVAIGKVGTWCEYGS